MFDLSMQSALDIFCYVLVLIYGLALSADISTGGHVSRQQKYLLTLLCLLFLLVQGLGLVLLGERTVKQLYPLVIHVPLVWGDRIFEKCGIGRDERGDGGKTLEIRGKRRLSARDRGANYQQS